MKKGILYAIGALVLLIAMAHTAYAWTTWPHEDCSTWIPLTRNNTTINQPGCYQLTANNYNTVYIDVPDANGQPVVLDLDGYGLSTLRLGHDYNGIIEVYNGRVNNGELADYSNYSYRVYGDVYLHDVIGSFNVRATGTIEYNNAYSEEIIIYAEGDANVVIDDVFIGSKLIVYGSPPSLTVRNATVGRDAQDIVFFEIAGSHVVLENVTFPLNTVMYSQGITPTFTISNATVGDAPLHYDNNVYNWDSNSAYIVDTIPQSSPVYVREIICLSCDENTDLNAPPSADIALKSHGNIYNFFGTIHTGPFRARITGIYDSEVYYDTSVQTSGRTTIANSTIHTGIYYAYDDTNAEGSTIDVAPGSINIYNDAEVHIGKVITGTGIYVHGGTQPDYDLFIDTWEAAYSYYRLSAYSPRDTVRLQGTHLTAQSSGALDFYLEGDNVTYVFDSVSVDENISNIHIQCQDSNQTVVFEGLTDTSKFDVSGCQVIDYTSCTPISTSTYTITQPGCYVLTTDVTQITVDNSTQYAGNIEIDLNGHTLGKLAPSSIIDHWPADTYVHDGYYSNTSMISAVLGGHTFKMSNVTVTGSGLFLGLFGEGTVVLENVAAPDATIYLPNGPGLELNQCTARSIELTTSYPVRLVDAAFTDGAIIRTSSSTSLYMEDVNLPAFSAIGCGSGGIYANNVYVAGIPVEVAPATVSSGGAYFVFEPQDWQTTTHVYYLDFLEQGSGVVSGVDAEYLGLGYGVSEIRDSNIGLLVLADTTFSEIPDFYNTYVGSMSYGIPVRGAGTWNVVDSNVFIPNLEALQLQELNLEGSELRFSRIMFYKDVNIIGGYMNSQSNYDGITTAFVSTPSAIRFIGTKIGAAQGTFPIRLNNNWESVVFDGASIGNPGDTLTISVDNHNSSQDVMVVFDSVSVPADSVVVQCTGQPVTVVLRGTTPASKFSIEGCAVDNQTIKPNLTATSDQTYADIAEGDIVEYNVTVTSYDAPVDNVVVRATASNYYTQFNQTLEQTIPHIDANQSVTITFEFNLASSPATYKITATVDPDNTIEESDETDNTTQRFYVNVLRYDPACGTLTTGMYKLTQHMTIDASQSEPCYYIPNGETVMFLGGTGITAPTIDFKVFFVEGSLSIHGLWGRGKIHVASSGYAYLDYVSPNTSDGWVVWNEGTTRISRNSEITMLFQAGGTVYVDGPDATIHEYHAYDFTGTTALQLFTDPAGATFAVGTTSAAMYADQPISGDGAYFYLNTAPSVAAQTDSIAALILANGQDGAVSDMNIYYIQVGGKRNDPSELNLTNVNVSGSILIDDQPNGDNSVFSKLRMVNSTANISELGADSGEYYFVNTTVTADNLRFWNNSKVYLDNSSLSIGEFELYSDDSTPVYIFADTTNGPVNIDINSFVGTDPLVIECAPNGHYFLYLSDNIFDYNTTIDPSCYPYIDYQRNLRVDIVAAPDSVNPDTNYQITARVYNDAQYTDFTNVVVRLYVDGVPTAEEEVNVPAGDAADVQFTVHSTPEVGTQQIDVVVDPDDIVFEANEQDNIATKEVVVEVQQAPTSNPAPSVGAGGPAAIAATQAIYVSAKVGEEKETAIHVSWKYGFPTKARITYININGKIIGPEEVELHTGDNIIPIKVIPSAYGEVGKVIIYAQNEKQEVTVYARPLAQLATAGIDVKVILILAGIVWLLYLYFRK